jgi:hypothetical protein
MHPAGSLGATATLGSRKEVIPLAIKYDPAADAPAATQVQERPGRIGGWLRELFRPEPADVRRQRIEAEAAAELGLSTSQQPEHEAGH